MNLGLFKNKRKQYGFKRFLNSFKYATSGFKFVYQNEQNLIIHICVAIIVIISSFIFRLNNFEWLFVLIMIGLVFFLSFFILILAYFKKRKKVGVVDE